MACTEEGAGRSVLGFTGLTVSPPNLNTQREFERGKRSGTMNTGISGRWAKAGGGGLLTALEINKESASARVVRLGDVVFTDGTELVG